MNKFFLLIPAPSEEYAESDVAYLKILKNTDKEELVNIVRKIKGSFQLIEGDDFEVYYDKKYLKSMSASLSDDVGMPQLRNLLLFFNDFKSIQEMCLEEEEIIVNGITIKSGLLNAFVVNNKGYDSLLNVDALNNMDFPIQVMHQNDCNSVKALECDSVEVYKWMVEHRYPERKLDENYEKHSKNRKRGRRGVIISSLSYTKEELEFFLKRAVGSKSSQKELYFKDKSRNNIIIFFNENLLEPTFHAFEVDVEDTLERSKIYKRGGDDLFKRIEETSKLLYD